MHTAKNIPIVPDATPEAATYDENCRRCGRLASFLDTVRARHADYWCRPVPPSRSSRPSPADDGRMPRVDDQPTDVTPGASAEPVRADADGAQTGPNEPVTAESQPPQADPNEQTDQADNHVRGDAHGDEGPVQGEGSVGARPTGCGALGRDQEPCAPCAP